MKLSTKIAGFATAAGIAAFATLPAWAQDAAAASPIPPQTMDKGDNTWMLVSTLLVLMMSIPGLAFLPPEPLDLGDRHALDAQRG